MCNIMGFMPIHNSLNNKIKQNTSCPSSDSKDLSFKEYQLIDKKAAVPIVSYL